MSCYVQLNSSPIVKLRGPQFIFVLFEMDVNCYQFRIQPVVIVAKFNCQQYFVQLCFLFLFNFDNRSIRYLLSELEIITFLIIFVGRLIIRNQEICVLLFFLRQLFFGCQGLESNVIGQKVLFKMGNLIYIYIYIYVISRIHTQYQMPMYVVLFLLILIDLIIIIFFLQIIQSVRVYILQNKVQLKLGLYQIPRTFIIESYLILQGLFLFVLILILIG
eukprot:TRINITY_DN5098_c1_g1_i2.p2 TRINITY_DN5098_c1_g1~~TRINITY_DN5098_c1_g1_i2.p2  ORF type:complete len:218 (+),score=-18.70 TRINITY_DN5098_c1_g1_i2:228-881(+)